MKKIRFLINTLSCGGAETVLMNLISSLPKEAFSISVVSICGGVNEQRIPKHVEYKRIIRIRNRYLERFLYKLIWHIPRRIAALLFLKGTCDCEIAYIEGLSTQILSKKKTSGKKIAFVHCDVSVDNIILKLYKSRMRCCKEYDSFDRVVFVSEAAQQGFFITIKPLNNSIVLHNILDISLIRLMSHEACDLDYNTHGVKLISVGRLSKEKNFSLLLNVVAKLKSKYEFELWIVGDGEERELLQKQINDFNLDNVRLLGYQRNPYKYMVKADYYVCSSLYEGYSTSVQEAIVLKKPVLTTDCAGMREILQGDRYGIIVENNEQSLLYGLDRLMYSHSTDYQCIVSRFDDDKCYSEQLLNYIELFNGDINV